MAVRNGVTVRGTSNGNERGSAEDRRRRKEWLLATYASDKALVKITPVNGLPYVEYFSEPPEVLETYDPVQSAEAVPTCRCYRCGRLLWFETLTVDRVVPGCKGGTYRRTNIRPACSGCNSETGGELAKGREHQSAKRAARRRRAAERVTGVAAEMQEVLLS